MTDSGWSYRGHHFAPGDASLFASVRQKKAAWVTRSIRAGHGHMADQSGVWDELASKNAKRGVASPTGAMRDFYQGYEEEMAEAPRELAPVPGQTGSLVYLSGRWAGMDLLAGPSLLAAPLRRVCGGCDSPEIQQPLHAESGAALIADDRVAHLIAFPVVATQ